MKQNILIVAVSIIALVALLFVPLPNQNTRETAAIAFLTLGGMISKVITCNEGFLITVGPPRPGEFMVTPGVIAYGFTFGLVHPGQFILGLASPVAVNCTVGIITVGSGLRILIMGTSR